MSPELLKQIILDQRDESIPADPFSRQAEKELPRLIKNSEVIVITGVRRCGKSVLLHQVRQQCKEKDYYFNFEDERLVSFTVDDFQLLYSVFLELYGEQRTFYFDEIQNIPGWEMFVRRLYNSGNKIFITGSNAALFSEELGTRLTGRYMTLRIYPFSFAEYQQHTLPALSKKTALSTKESAQIKKLYNAYCQFGGIPRYLQNHDPEYLSFLYESILYRDIVARYKLATAPTLKKMVYYLASNCSKPITYNALRTYLELGSATTVSDYCHYLEMSYLCFFVNRYHASLRTQSLSPKKIYFIDHALAKMVGFRFSEDKGRLLENIVFIELKRRFQSIYYHHEKKECDFVIQEKTKITLAIQVCYELTRSETRQREIEGLLDALETHQLGSGLILTQSEEKTESVTKNNKTYRIIIMPVWKWLLEN